MTRFALSLSLFALLAVPSTALADTIYIGGNTGSSTENLGDFEGSLSYDSSSGLLTVSLTNTSDASNGGYITAFALDQPDLNGDTSLTLSSTNTNFNLLFDPDTPPPNLADGDKLYEFGASTSDNWLGNGQNAGPPSAGIGVGQTATFTFDFTSTELNWGSWSAGDFLAPHPILVRFRGFEDGGSDKVPGQVVPEPSTWAMGLLALFVLGGVRRRTA